MDNVKLELILKDDVASYGFMLSPNDVLTLMGMPYKLSGSGTPGKSSHRIIHNGEIDMYRLGDELQFLFNNTNSIGRRNVMVNINFKELEKKLSDIYTSLLDGNSEILQLG